MLASQVRSGLVETVHDGTVAVVDSNGNLVAASGDIHRPFYFRSAAKPFQAAISLRLGAPIKRETLAIACASHDGEPVHVGLSESVLANSGLTEEDLQCPPNWPLRVGTARRYAHAGATQGRRLWHNCSGKHAAMLAACVASGFPIDTYLSPEHPLQQEIADYISGLAGPIDPIGIDGCGAPVFATSALGMARAFARLGNDPDLDPVYVAMHSYPALVSGYGNSDAAIATELNAVAKRGAAGCLGISLGGGYGIAIKVWDGNEVVPGVAAVAALRQLGLLTPLAEKSLAPIGSPATKGGGQAVGSFQPLLELA